MKRRILFLTVILPVFGILALLWSDFKVSHAAKARIFDETTTIPGADTALVLGCIPVLSNGIANPFFEYRMDAAAELWKSSKVKYLLVSGDNRRKDYDEPTWMKEALVKRGVPENVIYCDFAGRRTLDSVIRAQKVFGQERIIVVSQPFHNERALFIAQARGIEAYGFNAESVATRYSIRTHLREYLARAMAIADVSILNRQPHFLGDPIQVGDLSDKESVRPAS